MTDLQILRGRVERLVGQRQSLEHRHEGLVNEVAALEHEQTILAVTKAALEHLLKSVSAESLGQIEKLVTYGLSVVVPDRQLTLRAAATSKRNAPWVDLTLVSRDGVECPILDSFGGGPATVVAFLLRLLAARRLKLAPVVLLDESFSHVSEDYVPNVSALLRELADKVGLTILLVTHQASFVQGATRAYQITGSADGSTFTDVTA